MSKTRYFLMFVVFSILGCSLVLAVFDPRSWFTSEETVSDLGFDNNILKEETFIPEPYIYEWIYPPNGTTLGGDFEPFQIEKINYTYFWSLFENNSNWILEYTSKIGDPWIDYSNYIDFTVVRDNNGFEKQIINFTAPSTGYYRLNYTINGTIIDYSFNATNWEYSFTYDIPNSDRNYTIYYNWSDVVHSSWNQYIIYDYGVNDNGLYLNINITAKISKNAFISIDPYFGNSGTSSNYETTEDTIRGTLCTLSETGLITQFMAYLSFDGGWKGATKMAMYDDNENLVLTSSAVSSGVGGWVTYDVTDTYFLPGDYWITICGHGGTKYAYVAYTAETVTGGYQSYSYPSYPPSTFSYTPNTRNYCVLANYTLVQPIQEYEKPIDESTNINLIPDFNISVDDPNNDDLFMTFNSNESGSWKEFVNISQIKIGAANGNQTLMLNLSEQKVGFDSTETGSGTGLSADQFNGIHCNVPYNGTISSAFMCIDSGWTTGEELKFLIYNESLGLIGESNELTTGGSGCFEFTFASPVSVNKGDLIYIGCFADDAITMKYLLNGNSVLGWGRVSEDMTYPTPEDPIGSWDNEISSSPYYMYALLENDTGTYPLFENCNTDYWWSVNISDGTYWNNETYSFTTIACAGGSMSTPIINFAGNTSLDGGPMDIPIGTTDADAGYYTSNSEQWEDFIYMNVSCANATNVKLNYTNNGGSSWNNDSESFEPAGDYWELTLNVITASTGKGFSFDVYACNDTDCLTTEWQRENKTGGTERRWVKLNQDIDTDVLNYDIYYIWYDNVTTDGNDVQWHDQGQQTPRPLYDYAMGDAGVFNSTVPGDYAELLYCDIITWAWWNETVCFDNLSVNNIVFHTWWSINESDSTLNEVYFGLGRDRDATPDETIIGFPTTQVNENLHPSLTNISNVVIGHNFPQNRNFKLNDIFMDNTDEGFSGNSIYEFAPFFKCESNSTQVMVYSNRSMLSYFIINVPSNATLNSTGDGDTDDDGLSDWYEIYVTHTNPEITDTDNDGVDDLNECIAHSGPNNYTDTDSPTWNNLIMNNDFTFSDTLSESNLVMNNDFTFSDTLSQQNLLLDNDFSFSHILDETNLVMNNDFTFSDTLSQQNLILDNDFTFSDSLQQNDLLMNNDFTFKHVLDETILITNQDFFFSDNLVETNLLMNNDFSFKDKIFNDLLMNNDFMFSNILSETNLIMNQDFSFSDNLVQQNLILDNDFSFSDTITQQNLLLDNDFTFKDTLSETNLIMNNDFSFSDTLSETNLIMDQDFSFKDNIGEVELITNQDFYFNDILSENNLLMNNDFSFSDILSETNLIMNQDFSFKDQTFTELITNQDFTFSDALIETNLIMNNDFSFSDTLSETNLIMNNDFTFKDIAFNELITNQDFSFSDTLSETNLIMNNDFTFSDTLSESNLVMNNDFTFSDTLSQQNLLLNNDFTFSDTVEWHNLLMNNDFSFTDSLIETNLLMNNDFTFSDTITQHNLLMNNDFTFSDQTNWINLIMNQNFIFYASSATLTISNVYPSNNSIGISKQPYLYATFNSSLGKTMNVTWYYGLSEGNETILIETDENITNSTQSCLLYIASDSYTTYYWRVWVNDGTNNINETFSFTTEGLMGISPRSSIGIVGVIGIFGVLGFVFVIVRRRRNNEY